MNSISKPVVMEKIMIFFGSEVVRAPRLFVNQIECFHRQSRIFLQSNYKAFGLNASMIFVETH